MSQDSQAGRLARKFRTARMRRTRHLDGITVYPIERLGNQLFIYAAGLAQARRLGCPCYVNLGFYGDSRPTRDYAFQYGLGSFDNGLVVPEDEAAHRPVLRGLPVMSTAARWQRTIGRRFEGLPAGLFIENSYEYDPRIEQISTGTTLLGFFQSWRYFDSIADELRERMRRLTTPSAWYLDTADLIRPGDGSIILNVRRGDYATAANQAFHGLATRRYYERALKLARRTGADGTVYVLTDSLPEVIHEFDGMADIVPLQPPRGTDPFELIGILARADVLVAANSSFSWWGGWLGERPGRLVVTPRPWVTTRELDTRDLLPPDWITLDRAS